MRKKYVLDILMRRPEQLTKVCKIRAKTLGSLGEGMGI